jgi:hypothetical protein
MAMTTEGKNRIMIYGPKADGTYVVEFKTAAGEALGKPPAGGRPKRRSALGANRTRRDSGNDVMDPKRSALVQTARWKRGIIPPWHE